MKKAFVHIIKPLTLCFSMVLLAACSSPGEVVLQSDTSASFLDQEQPEAHEVTPSNEALPSDGLGWVLVWADEFNSGTLDRSKWAPEVSCWGGGNEERQCYTDRPDNIQISDGHLKLIAKPEKYTGPLYPQERRRFDAARATKHYTSGKVRTLGLHYWRYGRFEARMKLPKGQGTWPAFWMMPVEDKYGKWASSGEIDIMEAVNLGAPCAECDGNIETRTLGALHYGGEWPHNMHSSEYRPLGGGVSALEDFHTFALEWSEEKMTWYVDDVEIFQMTADEWFSKGRGGKSNEFAPFDRPFYLMLNLAVGGRLSEERSDKGFDPASFPNEVLVDWVRVYQCGSDPRTGRACMRDEKS